MKIIVTTPTSQDYEKFSSAGMNAEACLVDRVKLICQDDAGHVAESFMKQDEFDRLGLAYIEQHAKLEHSEVCDEWFMKCSQNSWYNDLEHNPEKVIKVMFVGIEDGTGREVYRGVETQRYYLREVHANQLFAKWYVCGERRVWEDGREPRPNLVFQLEDQMEKVVYDDWNGVAAYKDQFNKNFREQKDVPMIIQMTERVQASIIAVQAYRKWLWANKIATIGAGAHWDEHDDAAVASYWRTVRPEGTDISDACLKAALSYPIEDTANTESFELPQRFSFGW